MNSSRQERIKNEHIKKLNGDLFTQEHPGSGYADFAVFVKDEMTKN